MTDLLGATWTQAAATVLASAGMYLVLVVCIRLFGARRVTAMSAVDLGCAMAVGAVVGRASLLIRPTLTAGVLATATLFAMQRLLTVVRRHRLAGRVLAPAPVLLVAQGALLPAMRAAGVTEDDLRQRLRLAGVRSLTEVEAVVLETTGTVSVIRTGAPVDPWLLTGVSGAGRLGGVRAARP